MVARTTGGSKSQHLYWFLPCILLVVGLSGVVVMAAFDVGRHASRSQFVATLPEDDMSISPVRFDVVVAKTDSFKAPSEYGSQIEQRVDYAQRSRWVLKGDSMRLVIDKERFGLERQRNIAFNFARGDREPSRVFSQPFLAHVREPGADRILIRPAAAYVGVTDLSENRQRVKLKRRKADLRCLAQAIYFEARSEPTLGQIAVANVVLNRVKSPHYPDNICGVVYQNHHRHMSCQFTFACDGQSDRPRKNKHWAKAERIAAQVLDGKKLLRSMRNATHYHATYVSPKWSRTLSKVKRVGRHIFYKNQRWVKN